MADSLERIDPAPLPLSESLTLHALQEPSDVYNVPNINENLYPRTIRLPCFINNQWNRKIVSLRIRMELEFAWNLLKSRENDLEHIFIIFILKLSPDLVNSICSVVERCGLDPIVDKISNSLERLSLKLDNSKKPDVLIEVGISNDQHLIRTYSGFPLFTKRRSCFTSFVYTVFL